MKILGLILISYLMGILTQRIINHYNNKRENEESLKDLKDLQERLDASFRQAETSTFDGVITLITGEKIESEFFIDFLMTYLLTEKIKLNILEIKL
ncbi:hypothetical protein ACI513_03370 [Chryseobacterium sp. M5]|uniref:hypothetical protein n=1 Tax=Chryseobacterium sp. M5 TaxID=3379128 RepID=UPI00385735AE